MTVAPSLEARLCSFPQLRGPSSPPQDSRPRLPVTKTIEKVEGMYDGVDDHNFCSACQLWTGVCRWPGEVEVEVELLILP